MIMILLVLIQNVKFNFNFDNARKIIYLFYVCFLKFCRNMPLISALIVVSLGLVIFVLLVKVLCFLNIQLGSYVLLRCFWSLLICFMRYQPVSA